MRSKLGTAAAVTAALTLFAAAPIAISPARAQSNAAQPGQPGQQPQAGPPGAQTKPGPGEMKVSEQDKDFAHKVAKGGMMQVKLSEIAAKQTDNPKVREFAVTTIANLSKAGGMLHAMAKEAGIDLPQQPPDDVKRLTDALAADKGETLDHE